MSFKPLRGCWLLCLLLFCGCNGARLGNIASNVAGRVVAQPNPHVELLESELRWMEDNLYLMDDHLDRTLEQLHSVRRQNAILRLELADARKSSDPRGAGRSTSTAGSPGGRKSASGSDEAFDEEKDDEGILDLTPPDVKIGPSSNSVDKNDPVTKEENNSSGSGSTDRKEPEQLERPANVRPLDRPLDPPDSDEAGVELREFPEIPEPRIPPAVDPGAPSDTPPVNPFGAPDEETIQLERPKSVTRIVLNRRLTGGYSFDGVAGHEGIMVVVEPQSETGEYVPAAGEVLVHVSDPGKDGTERQIATWRLGAFESARFLKQTLLGKGIHLQLPWPGPPPTSRKLLVSVDYQTADGRKLNTTKSILVEPQLEALESALKTATPAWSPDRPPRR